MEDPAKKNGSIFRRGITHSSTVQKPRPQSVRSLQSIPLRLTGISHQQGAWRTVCSVAGVARLRAVEEKTPKSCDSGYGW